jgi:hypothetical protein
VRRRVKVHFEERRGRRRKNDRLFNDVAHAARHGTSYFAFRGLADSS